jgi:hypothetical protein
MAYTRIEVTEFVDVSGHAYPDPIQFNNSYRITVRAYSEPTYGAKQVMLQAIQVGTTKKPDTSSNLSFVIDNISGEYVNIVVFYKLYQIVNGETVYDKETYSETHKYYHNIQWVNYVQPWIKYDEVVPLSASGEMTIEVYGAYTPQTLPSGYKNKLDGISVRIPSLSFYEVYTVTPSESGTFRYEVELKDIGLEYQSSYQIIVETSDYITQVSYYNNTLPSVPSFQWDNSAFYMNVPLVMDDGIVFQADQGIAGYGTREMTRMRNLIVPVTSENEPATEIGKPWYEHEIGTTRIYGNQVDIIAHNGVTINGKTIVGQTDKVLWSGVSHMNGSQSITLSQNISSMANGIVLVFSLYRNGAAEDVSINSFYVSKKEVELLPGAPHTYMMNINAGFSGFGAKYLYIYDNRIVGHDTNTTSSANSGVTFNNSQYVLRYVIGV